MTTELEPYYQEMGRLALEVASDDMEVLMIYAEIDAEGLSADLYYRADDPDVIHYRLVPPVLEAVIDAYWDAARQLDPKGEWQAMTYVIEEGAFRVVLRYPDEIDEYEDIAERRPAAVRAVLGEGVIDYSAPGL